MAMLRNICAPEDRAIGNAIQGGSVAFGVVIGGTLGLVLYAQIGWTGMLLTIAGFSLIPLFAAFAMREDEAGQIDPSKPRPSVMAFLRRREVRNILWIALIYRMSEGLVKAMEGSYLVDAGVPLKQIGYLSGGAATTAGLAGAAGAAVAVATLRHRLDAGSAGHSPHHLLCAVHGACAGRGDRHLADFRRGRIPDLDPLYGDRRALQPVHGGGIEGSAGHRLHDSRLRPADHLLHRLDAVGPHCRSARLWDAVQRRHSVVADRGDCNDAHSRRATAR